MRTLPAILALLFLAGCNPHTGLTTELQELRQENAELKIANELLIQQVAKLEAASDRQTWLYDGNIIAGRKWVIPADVEPHYVGNGAAEYSHYDPKTQIETVHLKPH
jgi:hypothetical protein